MRNNLLLKLDQSDLDAREFKWIITAYYNSKLSTLSQASSPLIFDPLHNDSWPETLKQARNYIFKPELFNSQTWKSRGQVIGFRLNHIL